MVKRKRDELLFLEDILEAINRIEAYTFQGKDEFLSNQNRTGRNTI